MASQKVDVSFLHGRASEIAPRLLGGILERTLDGKVLRARIVEVEAYDQTDVASHSYKGETPRTKIMFEGVFDLIQTLPRSSTSCDPLKRKI